MQPKKEERQIEGLNLLFCSSNYFFNFGYLLFELILIPDV